MRHITPVAVALLLASITVAQEPKSLAIPADDTARARKLVVQLDSDERTEREAASAELAKLGRRALPVLKTTLFGKPSAEVRRRVNDLLPDARIADFKAGAEVFIADKEDKHKHDFEGWAFLKDIAGDTPGSRKLMRLILSDKPSHDIICTAFGAKDDALLAFHARWKALRVLLNNNGKLFPRPDPLMPLAPIAGMLLAESLCPGEHPKHYYIRAVLITESLKSDTAKKAVAGEGEYGAALRKLVLRWVDSRDTANGIGELQMLYKPLLLGPEYPALVDVRILKAPDCDPITRVSSLCGLAHKDTEAKHLSAFADHLSDKTVAQPASGMFPDIQVRDVALLYLVLQTKQVPGDYGFTTIQKGPTAEKLYNSYGFVDDKAGFANEKREAALKKWAEWSAKNLKAEPKK